MKRTANDLFVVGVVVFNLIALIRSNYDSVIWVTGTVLVIAGAVLGMKSKKKYKFLCKYLHASL